MQKAIEFREQQDGDVFLISAYGDGGFRVRGQRLEGGLFIAAKYFDTFAGSDPSVFPACLSSMHTTLHSALELILFGTGQSIVPLPENVTAWLVSHHIGYDIMDTGAAARTYNVLVAEGRRVAACLLPV